MHGGISNELNVYDDHQKQTLLVVIGKINQRLSDLMGNLEDQPYQVKPSYGQAEMHATERWWSLCQLRHILCDMENYTICKIKMQMHYKRLKEKMTGKGNFLNDI